MIPTAAAAAADTAASSVEPAHSMTSANPVSSFPNNTVDASTSNVAVGSSIGSSAFAASGISNYFNDRTFAKDGDGPRKAASKARYFMRDGEGV